MTRTSGWADSFCVVLWRDHGSSFAHLMPVSSDSSTDADMHPHVSMDAQQATSNSSLSHSFGKSAVSTGAFETNQAISPLASNVGSIWNTLSNGVCSSSLADTWKSSKSQSTSDRFIPCRGPLDRCLANYLLEVSVPLPGSMCCRLKIFFRIILQAPSDEQDAESTPSKQDYMNTLKEGVLQASGDSKVICHHDHKPVFELISCYALDHSNKHTITQKFRGY